MLYVELVIALGLIVLNGVLAMAELAIVSSRRSRLQSLVDKEVVGARRALALASDPGRFLSTVQIGITLVGILSGAYSGATLGVRFGNWLETMGLGASAANTVGMGVVVALITYASLIVGELVPKQIALRDPERIAVRVAPAMTWLARISGPLVWLLDISGDAVLRLLGYRAEPEKKVTEEEIKALIAEAESAGVIAPGERAMISGVLRLGDRAVRSVMTPRTDVDMINLNAGPDAIRQVLSESPHSRFPTHEGNPDEIIGVLQAKDIVNSFLRTDTPDFRGCVVQAPVVPDTVDALDVVDIIKNSTVHMVLVHDEYGQFEGIVTNADLLDSIVGQSFEATETERAVQRADGSWLVPGSMAVDEMADALAIPLPPERPYHTAAGFALAEMGQLPAVGETFDAMGWRFEVIDLDGRRIDKLMATRTGRRSKR